MPEGTPTRSATWDSPAPNFAPHAASAPAKNVLPLLLVLSAPVPAQESERPAEPQGHDPTPAEVVPAGKLFERSCVSCHLPPNPDLPRDRAWLEQVKDTA